jgi:ribonuclease-3
VSIDRLERKLKYRFRDPELLALALTHRSHGAPHNERLEFLGDATLGYVAAERLYRQHPCATEHELTLMRVSIVERQVLADVARDIDLGSHLTLGSGAASSGGHRRDSILANTLEAVIGAVACDGGVEAARAVVNELFSERIENAQARSSKDPKTRLQELLHTRRIALPRYTVDAQTGDAHDPSFTVECRIAELDLATRGEGRSRREAEKAAALRALELLGSRRD